jgi:hypothetical protein
MTGRRNFLKKTGLGTAGAALAGLQCSRPAGKAGTGLAAVTPGLRPFLSAVLPLINPGRVIDRMAELSRLELPADFDSFHLSAQVTAAHLRSLGLQSSVTYFPADGETRFQAYTAPIGFRTRRALCTLVRPEPFRKVLGDRAAEPNTAIAGSGHTGPDGIAAEAVWIQSRDDLARKKIKGKIVYTGVFHPMEIRADIIRGGGRALVSSFMNNRREMRREVKWINTWDWQTDGWLPTKKAAQENLPGISISPEMGEYLERQLAAGPVTLQVTVEGEYFSGQLPAVTAVDLGDSPVSILLVAHLFEPGFIGNASGVCLAAECAALLQQVKKQSRKPRFKRTLKLFHSLEDYGVQALPGYRPDFLAGIKSLTEMESVGLQGETLVSNPPLRAASGFGPFLFRRMLDEAGKITGFRTADGESFAPSCTILNDPWLAGIPSCHLVLKSWADGRRSVYEIIRRALYEMPQRAEQLTLGYALDFFRAYANHGLVEFKA